MCPRERHITRSDPPRPSRDEARESPAGDRARARRRGSVSSYPSRGWGSRGGIVEVPLPDGGGAPGRLGMPGRPGRAGVSSRRGNSPTTRGVRADRVGVVLARRRSQGRIGAGVSGVASASSVPWLVKPRLATVDAVNRGLGLVPRGEQRCPCSVQGRRRPAWLWPRLTTRTLGGDGAEGLRLLRVRADAGERGERSARAHAGLTLSHAGRGSGGRRSCSRIELVAEVDEPRWVQAGRPGSSTRRWKASWSGAGVVFDETASGLVPATRGEGDAAAMPDPPRAHEDVRGHVASPSAVEQTAGGRSGAEEPSIGAPPGLRWTPRVNGRGLGPGRGAFIGRHPSGDHARVAAEAEAGGSPSSEAPPGWLTRHAVGRSPRISPAAGSGPG